MAKKTNKSVFDVPQYSFDGAEVSELMGPYLRNKINKIVYINDHGLYRGDRLMAVADKRRVNDKIRQELPKIFKNLGFIIEVDMNSLCEFG